MSGRVAATTVSELLAGIEQKNPVEVPLTGAAHKCCL